MKNTQLKLFYFETKKELKKKKEKREFEKLLKEGKEFFKSGIKTNKFERNKIKTIFETIKDDRKV